MTIQEYADNHPYDDEWSEEDEQRYLELKKKDDEIERLQNELDDYKYYWETLSEWLNLLVAVRKEFDSINYRESIKISDILKKMTEIEEGKYEE